MNWRVVSAQINSFSTSAILLLLLLITILSGVMYLTVWQPQRRSIAGSVDLHRPGGLSLFQLRLNYSSYFRLCVFHRFTVESMSSVMFSVCDNYYIKSFKLSTQNRKISVMKIVMILYYVLVNIIIFFKNVGKKI